MSETEKIELPTYKKFVNLLSVPPKRFGRLIVIEYAGQKMSGGKNRQMWKCKCDCGNYKITSYDSLRDSQTISCGCYNIENCLLTRERVVTHAKTGSPEHNTWKSMKQRCYNPKCSEYHYYGGRGIKICERWLNDTKLFYEDMGPRPSATHSIDRIDVNGDYCPENCRWASVDEQANNKRNTIMLTINKETKTAKEWSVLLNITLKNIYNRKNLGWTDEEILLTPIDKTKSRI